ncbi:MAG: AAA family ATPase [Pseudomonadota bacterium]
MEVTTDDDLIRAALLGAFDPRDLVDMATPDGGSRLRVLAKVATEVQVGDRWLWTLTPDARRAGLARLPGPKARGALLQGLPVSTDDALAEALRLVLSGGGAPPVVARLRRSAPKGKDLPALLQLLQAVDLLRSAGVALEGWAAVPDIDRRLRRVTVQADKAMESLQILPRKLHGRQRELKAFLDFAKTGAVDSPVVTAATDQPPPTANAPPTVILSGLGGSGKSTLLEALRRRLARDPSILQVTFDLDEPALRAGHRVALTQELLRQIGEARPELDARLSALRTTLRGAIALMTEGSDPSREASAVVSSLADLNAILMEEGKGDPISLILTFDTFEEAVALGEGRVRLIADWIGLVGAHRLTPRVILAGREADTLAQEPLPGLAVLGWVQLGDLGVQAGRALLRDRFEVTGVDAGDLVPKLVETFGSDALTLMMLARFAASIGKTGKALQKDLVALAQDEGSEVREKLDAEMRQTFLFSRILNRLPKPELQALASPGLVLRQVTPRLILEVLAGPCGLPGTLTLGDAEALFKDLAAMAWLVKPVAGVALAVEHVPALRRRMLPQVLKDERAKAVVAAAAGWYAARAAEGDATAGLEAIYYRALGDPDALTSDPEVLRALADHLGPAMGDLTFARDRIRDAEGKVLSHAAVAGLKGAEVQKRARDRRRKFQLSEGMESAVIEEADRAMLNANEPMSPDLVMASFAALDIPLAVSVAPKLVRRLLDSLTDTAAPVTDYGEMTSDDLQGLSVAALQAATACLSPEARPDARAALRGAVQKWLADRTRRVALVAGYASALQQSNQLWPARLAAVLVLSMANEEALDRLGEPVATAVREMAKSSHSPFAWRALRLVGPLPGDATLKGIALAYLAPEVLPVLARGLASGYSQTISDLFRGIMAAGAAASVSDHNRVDAGLYREEIVLTTVLQVVASLPAALPGRLPEFHGAFRVILGGSDLDSAAVREAVMIVARFVPWWPKELGPEAFAEAPFSPTLISSLIDTADRCGRLPDLAAALARQKGAPLPCIRLSALIEAAVAHYRRAAGGAEG